MKLDEDMDVIIGRTECSQRTLQALGLRRDRVAKYDLEVAIDTANAP